MTQALAEVMSLQEQGQYARAEAILQSLLQQYPSHVEPAHHLGILRQYQGRSDEAVELIRGVLARCPTHAAAYNNLGNILRSSGRMAEAADAYRRAIELAPRDLAAYINLGDGYRIQKRYQEAVAVLQAAISLDAGHDVCHFNLGRVCEELGHYDQAIVEFQRAIQLAPGRASSYYVSLGKLLVQAGRVEEAAAVYRQLLAMAPGHSLGRHMLSACTALDVPPRASDGYLLEYFDDFAESFDKVLSAIGYRGPEMIAGALARDMPVAERRLNVLDAGCGTGLCAQYLRPYAHRLVGVDLSRNMLLQASAKRMYDELVQEEITAFLRRSPGTWDVIASADVLIYFGDLRELISASAAALRVGGVLAVTAEDAGDRAGEAGYRLEVQGRYSHSEGYLRRMMEQAGLQVEWTARDVLRKECRIAVAGLVMVGRKAAARP